MAWPEPGRAVGFLLRISALLDGMHQSALSVAKANLGMQWECLLSSVQQLKQSFFLRSKVQAALCIRCLTVALVLYHTLQGPEQNIQSAVKTFQYISDKVFASLDCRFIGLLLQNAHTDTASGNDVTGT